MSFTPEYKKLKRTGLFPAFFIGGIPAAAVPVLNMAFRSQMYIGINASPVSILLNANWQMMSMLNILLILSCACIMYHTEYADNAMQKMCTLPIKESAIFFGKTAVMIAMAVMMLALEMISIFFCALYWFAPSAELCVEILKNFGFFLLLTLPAILLSLLIASLCKNIWISLGIGVVCMFLATMIPRQNFLLTLFPFALPFQTIAECGIGEITHYAIACALESAVISLLEIAILKIRRWFA